MRRSLAPCFALAFSALLAPGAPGQGSVPPRQVVNETPTVPAGERFIRIDPTVLDFGEVDRGETFRKMVTLTNISNEPVRIVRAFTTCNCTVPSIPDQPIAPGQSVDVAVEFTSKSVGPFGSTARFVLDNQKGDVQLAVAANVRSPISVEPAQFDPDSDQNQTIRIKATDGKPFSLLAADPGILEGIDRQPRVEHEVILTAVKLRQLQHRLNLIRVYTDHPRMDSLMIRSSRLETTGPTRRLIEWAKGSGELGDLGDLLEEGADIMEADPQGLTALFHAAIAGQTERLRALLEFGGDPHATARDGRTVLIAAAMSKQSDPAMLSLLIEAGLNVNAVDQFGRNALYWSARMGTPETIRTLLDAGADPYARGPFSETALMSAVKSGRIDNVRMLVEAGADLHATDRKGHNALHHALALMGASRDAEKARRQQIVEYLKQEMARKSG